MAFCGLCFASSLLVIWHDLPVVAPRSRGRGVQSRCVEDTTIHSFKSAFAPQAECHPPTMTKARCRPFAISLL